MQYDVRIALNNLLEEENMRGLSDGFMSSLKTGHLSALTRKVIQDPDLDLQIRQNYLNIYYKGNSLLKLSETRKNRYQVNIHPKFLGDQPISGLDDEASVEAFLVRIPRLKENIITHGKSSLEIEYEQLIIRANNNEPRNNTEYFIIDRQYTAEKRERFDLTGIFWSRSKKRSKGQEVPLCLIEIKFALNREIRQLHRQLSAYHQSLQDQFQNIVTESQHVFRQKLDLGLYNQPQDRVEALKTLQISSDFDKTQFILILVDYNPFSTLLDLEGLKQLPFARQIKILYSGFGMWQQNLEAA
jgi:hypothetical protein